jgi:hypothetical protein
MEVDQEWKERVESVASLYLSLAPAAHVMLVVGPGKILYWLGSTAQPSFSEVQGKGTMATLFGYMIGSNATDRLH